MTLRSVLYSTAACMLLSSPIFAATVTLTVSGTTNESEGTLTYSPGSAFTAIAVFDDAVADGSADASVGAFFDFGSGSSALVSFELTTELGTVRYTPVLPPVASLPPTVTQIQTPSQQTFSLIGGADVWSGSMGSLLPNALTLSMGATGLGDYLFSDANSLFSGSDALDANPDLFAGAITVSEFGLASVFDETELFFGAGEFSITRDTIVPPLAPVPLPASLPFLAAGVLGLGWTARRKMQFA